MDFQSSSDDLPEIQVEQEFVYHPPEKDPSKKHHNTSTTSKYSHINEIVQRCEELKKEILMNRMTKSAKEICKFLYDRTGEKILVPIVCKRNQQSDLNEFSEILAAKIKQMQISQHENYQKLQKDTKIYHNFKEDEKNVKNIVLKIYMENETKRRRNDDMVFIYNSITDLSVNNVYVFEEGLTNVAFKLILPTFNDFMDYNFTHQNIIDVYPSSMYQSKSLFSQFMYNCIVDEKIKAYLPKQTYKLIYDLDDYPISYHEGCRRLIFCIMKYHMVLSDKKLTNRIQYVNLGNLFEKIQSSINSIFKVFKDVKDSSMIEKNIKCLMDQKSVYSVFQSYLNKFQWFMKDYDETQLMVEVRERLQKSFSKDESLKKYADIFDSQQVTSKPAKKTKKIRRQDKFGITPQIYKTQKDFLEDQLTKIIQIHTEKIRAQSKMVKWEEIDFENRIRPQIPLHLFKAVNQDPKKKKVLDEITSYPNYSLAKLLHFFCEKERNFGEFMYLMKDLHLHGMIDLIQGQINPTVTPSFFPKSSFTRKMQKNDY